MTKGLVVLFALPFACYSVGDDDSNGDDGGAGETATGGASGSAGSGGSSGRGGAGARAGSGGGGQGGSAGATAGAAGTSASGGTGGNGGASGSGASNGSGASSGSGASTGSGASSGSGGSGAVSGSGGSSGAGEGRLGGACVTDAECGTEGLTCLESEELDGAGPPKGLCTAACTNDEVCQGFAPGAFCIEFPGGQGYCIESCTLGGLGEPKCNEREEFGCGIVATTPGARACADGEDCNALQLCVDGVCSDPVTACVPVCGGDYNCEEGQSCDYASGFCVPGEPEGLPIGAVCDPAAAEDPCRGFCVAVDETQGMCSADCTFNQSATGCGFNADGPADAVCLWVPIYADPTDIGLGDTLFCGAMCDCNDQCQNEGWGCFAADTLLGAGAADFFGREGVCAPIAATDTIEDTLGACPDTGAGGSSGMGTGGAPGSAGEAGEAGAASGPDSGGEAR